jgi:hypothetical protein
MGLGRELLERDESRIAFVVSSGFYEDLVLWLRYTGDHTILQ